MPMIDLGSMLMCGVSGSSLEQVAREQSLKQNHKIMCSQTRAREGPSTVAKAAGIHAAIAWKVLQAMEWIGVSLA